MKAVNAKDWSGLYSWTDGTSRSYPEPTGLPFPRTGMLAMSGSGSNYDQTYSPVPYSSQVTPIGSNGYFSTGGTYPGSHPISWMGRFDICLIGGNWEQWDSNSNYDRGLLVDSIKRVLNVSGFSPTVVWQYHIFEVTQDASNSNPYNTLYPTIQNELWSLWSSANESGSQISVSSGKYETNWAVAWPNAVGSVPADQAFSTRRTTAHYDGNAEDLPQYAAAYFIEMTMTRHSQLSTYASGTIPASAYTDPRFYPNLTSGANHDAMKAPNLDAIFTDNCYAYPRYTGYYDLKNSYSANVYNSAAGPWMVRGVQHFHARLEEILALAYPSRQFYKTCNFGDWTDVYAQSPSVFSSMSNGLANTMHGGVLENDIGASYGVESKWDWPTLYNAIIAVKGTCLDPKMVLLSIQCSSSTDYVTARYGMGTTCIAAIYGSPNVNGSYRVDDYFYLDECGGNPGTNVAKGWLGMPVGPDPTGSAVNGLWIRDFTNGVVVLNPKVSGQGTATVTLAQINSYLGASYSLSYIKGVQDSSWNPGGKFSQATLPNRTALFLVK